MGKLSVVNNHERRTPSAGVEFQEDVEAYGEWPKEVITDGGPLVQGGLLLLAGEGEDRLGDCPRREEISDRGVLRGVP